MSHALEAAIADRAGRARRRKAARAFTAWWQARPEWLAAIAALDRARNASDAIDAVRPMLVAPHWLHDGIAHLATLARADPLFEPPLVPLREGRRSGLQLFRHRFATLAVIRLPPPDRDDAHGARAILFDGRPSLVRFLDGRGTVQRYRLDKGGRCRSIAHAAIDPAAMLDSPADEAWTITESGSTTLLLQATIRIGDPIALRSYDSETGVLLSAGAAGTTAMRLQLMATLLRRLDRRDAAEALADAARDGPYHQRWHLARELAALDRAAARPLLTEFAASDPHPEVRQAARATLALMAA